MNTRCLFLQLVAVISLGLMTGCGDPVSSTSNTSSGTLANAPAGFSFTDETGIALTGFSGGETAIQLRDGGSNILFSFTANGDVDFTNVTAVRSSTKSVIHFPATTDKAGITGTVTLYVPCVSNQNSVVVCPSATSADEVTTSCTDVVTVSPTTTISGNYTFANATTRIGATDCQITADIENFGSGALGNTSLSTLVSEDLNSTAPCPSQTLLTDSTFIADLKAATAFTLVSDNTNNDTICARGSNFTGSGTDTPITLSQFNVDGLLLVGIGVCGTDTIIDSLPLAGTYRRDFKFTANGRSYRFRLRAVVTAGSPDVLGQSIETVLGSSSIQSPVEYVDPAGTIITQDSTAQSSLINFLPNPINTFTVRKASDDQTLFTVKAELICAQAI
jgi:hypothetical protein